MARDRVDILHEARFDKVTLELGGYDLVCCLAGDAGDCWMVMMRTALKRRPTALVLSSPRLAL